MGKVIVIDDWLEKHKDKGYDATRTRLKRKKLKGEIRFINYNNLLEDQYNDFINYLTVLDSFMESHYPDYDRKLDDYFDEIGL